MSRIKIKNFGPIKDGFKEILDDGTVNEWMDIKKVTVFIGNQGSGKSTVAKLISALMWLEKALVRGDVYNPKYENEFLDLLGFHRIKNYLQQNTKIEFIGNSYYFNLFEDNMNFLIEKEDLIKLPKKRFKQPKIMYVPAERNFLSSITNINKVSDFIVGNLKNYAVEFRNAQLTYKDKQLDLPINKTKVLYDPFDDENYIVFKNKKLKLSEASSGFHSVVPLLWVSKYLTEYLQFDERILLEMLSTDQTIRRNKELSTVNKDLISESMLKEKEQAINDKYISKYLVNIVEEPEQNLFPSSQRSVLYSLLEYNNLNQDNKLIMTTHSPYLINYLTLCVKAEMVKSKLNDNISKDKLAQIVPLNSTIKAEDLVIYEMNEMDGTITKLSDYKGLPSDENYLNSGLEDSNELFAQLQEIEKGWR